jgi:hypothetical protein
MALESVLELQKVANFVLDRPVPCSVNLTHRDLHDLFPGTPTKGKRAKSQIPMIIKTVGQKKHFNMGLIRVSGRLNQLKSNGRRGLRNICKNYVFISLKSR